MASLQEQLLKAGLADAKKAKKINKEKRQQAKQQPKGQQQIDEAALAARQALAEKAERDRELNRQRDEQAQLRAIEAQIKQLITLNRIDRSGRSDETADVAYQFTHGTKIKKLYVTGRLQEQLINGLVAIVELEGNYELVPARIAEKISQRNPDRILLKNESGTEQIDEDDPYADYQIPDDLMW